ncbi:hypothetical protein DW757_06945 [Clostridium sp. AM29-11AC]|nr:hypothetical protein DW757_06945 [Clostridium sp. AM29-11AC]
MHFFDARFLSGLHLPIRRKARGREKGCAPPEVLWEPACERNRAPKRGTGAQFPGAAGLYVVK